MAQYPFLSEEWLEEAKKIREEHAGSTAAPAHAASWVAYGPASRCCAVWGALLTRLRPRTRCA